MGGFDPFFLCVWWGRFGRDGSAGGSEESDGMMERVGKRDCWVAGGWVVVRVVVGVSVCKCVCLDVWGGK